MIHYLTCARYTPTTSHESTFVAAGDVVADVVDSEGTVVVVVGAAAAAAAAELMDDDSTGAGCRDYTAAVRVCGAHAAVRVAAAGDGDVAVAAAVDCIVVAVADNVYIDVGDVAAVAAAVYDDDGERTAGRRTAAVNCRTLGGRSPAHRMPCCCTAAAAAGGWSWLLGRRYRYGVHIRRQDGLKHDVASCCCRSLRCAAGCWCWWRAVAGHCTAVDRCRSIGASLVGSSRCWCTIWLQSSFGRLSEDQVS